MYGILWKDQIYESLPFHAKGTENIFLKIIAKIPPSLGKEVPICDKGAFRILSRQHSGKTFCSVVYSKQ